MLILIILLHLFQFVTTVLLLINTNLKIILFQLIHSPFVIKGVSVKKHMMYDPEFNGTHFE